MLNWWCWILGDAEIGCVLLFTCCWPVGFDEAFIFYITDVQRHLQLLQFGNWPDDRCMLCWVHTGYKIPVQAHKSVCLKPRAGGTWKEFGFPWKPFNWTIYFYMNFNSINVIYRVCFDTGVSDEEFDLRLSSMYIHYIHRFFLFWCLSDKFYKYSVLLYLRINDCYIFKFEWCQVFHIQTRQAL